MDRMYDQISAVPGVQSLIYSVGPVIFFLAIVVLAVLHAATLRTGGAIAAAALLTATVLLGGQLDLLPISSLLLTAAFWLLRPIGHRARSGLPTSFDRVADRPGELAG